jgi:acyl phosphate:glycerol-3-phosphate acyltransferase
VNGYTFSMHYPAILVSLIPFYLIGAFPTGRLIAARYGVKIDQTGSGNVGASNVTRVLGKRAGLLTLAGDVLKGVLAVLLARWIDPYSYYPSLAGLAAICGHCFSIPGKLRGGKGVAVSLGVFLLLSPLATLFGLVVFIALAARFRIASLASLSAALTTPLFSMFTGVPDHVIYSLGTAALLITGKHHANIKRLIEGREPRFGQKLEP